MSRFARTLAMIVLLAPLALCSAVAHAAPVIGFIERWNVPGSTSSWNSFADNTNPDAGGADGAGDGYLRMARPIAGPLGSHSTGPEYTGDWMAANVNRIRLSLNDVGTNQALEIHVSIGTAANLWQFKTGFSPPENAWAQFTVDLTDSSQFSHIIALDGKGFAAALQNANTVLVRHDVAPYSQTPDDLVGEFGLDNFELTNSLLDVPGQGAIGGRPVELAAPYPNPARGAIACAFETFDESAVRVLILDAAGRIVRSQALPAAAPGRRVWLWDGRDERGQAAPAGAYRVRALGAFGGTSRPFVRLN